MSNSTTAAIQSLLALVALVAFGWKAYQLTRAPEDPTLRAVTLALFFYASAGALVVRAIGGSVDDLIGANLERLVRNLLITSAHFWMLRFVLLSVSGQRATFSRRFVRELLPFVVTVTVLVVTTILEPPRVPETLLSRQALASPSVALFYGTGNLYIAYTFSVVSLLCWQARRDAHPTLRRGLTITAAAAFVVGLSSIARILLVGVLASGRDIASSDLAVLSAPITYGLVVFFFGLTYPGTRQRARSALLWWRRRRAHAGMGPLWELLRREYPQIVLRRSPALERLGVRRVHGNYYRRYIEIRDALVPLSAFVSATDAQSNATERQVDVLLEALRRRTAGEPATTSGNRLFDSFSAELDDDARVLVRLSQALKGRQLAGPSPLAPHLELEG